MSCSRFRLSGHALVGLVLLAVAVSQAAAEQLPLQRWAVIASPQVAATGLADLMTVKLSQREVVQLVEREQLRQATRELQLAAMIKARNTAQRLQLGQTLRADALLVLSLEHDEGQRLLRVVVCDCRFGARLWSGRFVFGSGQLETQVEQCLGVVDEVRQRFADGIRRIIAVPPFLSENFELRHAYLQSRYSERLSSALTAHAGVVVVELDEARAIVRELQDTLSPGLERPAATIVEGRYRVTAADKQPRQVELRIELVSGAQREQINETLLLGTVGPWLTATLAPRLLAGSDAASLDSETQKAILTRHAQRCAELGDWERSLSLREAALVLDPNDALQRGLLISEYQYAMAPLIEANWALARFAEPLPSARRAAALQRVADDYTTALNHLEYLVRNRLVSRADAVGLLYTHRWYKRNGVGPALPFDPLKHAALQPARRAQREFLHEVAAEMGTLPGLRLLPARLSTPYYGLSYTLCLHAVSDVVFDNYSPESLAALRHVLEQVLPPDANVSVTVLSQMRRAFSVEQRQDMSVYREKLQALKLAVAEGPDDDARQAASQQLASLTPGKVRPHFEQAHAAWLRFLRQLTRADCDTLKLYGYWGLHYEAQRGRGVAGREKIEEAIATLADRLEQQGRLGPQVQKYIAQVTGRSGSSTPAVDGMPLAAWPPAALAAGPLGRMQLTPLKFTVVGQAAAGRRPLMKGMRACGGTCDAWWTNDEFFVMDQPGVLRKLQLTDKQADHILFWGITWDGECLWMHAHGQGIIAVRPDGTRLATYRQGEHLPSYGKGLQMLGLSPGRALIVGSFGETNRAWCGMLEVDQQGRQSANIFFEAKSVAEGRSPEQARADAKTVFQPVALQYVEHPGGSDYALVRRRDLPYLKIDLQTLQVTVERKWIGVPGTSTRTELGFVGPSFLRNGRPVWALSDYAWFPHSRRLVFHDDWIYRPGVIWLRQHVDTGQRELLQRQKIDHRYWQLRLAASAHYGLVMYDPHNRDIPLYQVTIADQPKATQEERQ